MTIRDLNRLGIKTNSDREMILANVPRTEAEKLQSSCRDYAAKLQLASTGIGLLACVILLVLWQKVSFDGNLSYALLFVYCLVIIVGSNWLTATKRKVLTQAISELER